MTRAPRLVVILAGALAATGCATFGTMQTASTVGQGHTRVALEPSMWGGALPGGSLLIPLVTLSAEYGVTNRFDVGGRVGLEGFEVWGKLELTPPVAPVIVSVAPSVGGMALVGTGTGGGVFFFQVPVLVGIRIGGSELVLGPKIHDWMLVAASGSTTGGGNLFSVGGSVGFALRLGSSFRVMPEVAVLRPVLASVHAGTDQSAVSQVFNANAWLLQFSVSLMFGG